MRRTGLALEAAHENKARRGARIIRRRFRNVNVTDVRVSKAEASRIGKEAGRYITIEGEPLVHSVPLLLEKALQQMLPSDGLVLAVGLGNPDIAMDSLGARVIRKLICHSGKRSIAAVETDVAVRTGIDTARMVRGLAIELNAACVLAVDALACCDPARIGRTVQISDTGIQPGSGVDENSAALCRCYVGIPVVAVGVPMVSELSGITGNPAHKGYLAAHADQDLLAERWAEVIADAVNGFFGTRKANSIY